MIYWVRHCSTTGQEPEAPLTAAGEAQAVALAAFLAAFGITRIVSSPYRRAVQSIEAFAAQTGLALETDDRLRERVLSPVERPDWQAILQRSFDDPDFCVPGGESSRAAADRAEAAFHAAVATGEPTVIVSHGNLTALLLGRLGQPFGPTEQALLTNPDVFRIVADGSGFTIARLWEELK